MPVSLFKTYNGKTHRTQNSTLPLLPVPDTSASQSYLSSCDAQCLSSLFLNDFTERAVMTRGNGRLFHTFVILNSSSTSALAVPRTRRRTIGDRAFPIAAARTWNSLPPEVTSSRSLPSFKSKLKTHLFKLSFPHS